jgi:hypothetical protein
MFHVIFKFMKAQHVVFVIYIWKELLLLFILYVFLNFFFLDLECLLNLCIDWHALQFFFEYIYIWCLPITFSIFTFKNCMFIFLMIPCML